MVTLLQVTTANATTDVTLSQSGKVVWGQHPGVSKVEVNEIERLTENLDAQDPTVRRDAERRLVAAFPSNLLALFVFATADKSKEKAIREFLCRIDGVVEEYVRRGYSLGLVCRGPEVIPSVIAAWHKYPLSPAPLRAFREFGKAATPFLIPLLKDSNIEIRSNAASIVADVADPAAADAMLTALGGDYIVADAAALYFQRHPDPRAADDLLRMVNSKQWFMRESGMSALSHAYEPRFLSPILGRAKWDENLGVRDTACNALDVVGGWSVRRLARRYRPLSFDPANEPQVKAALVMWQGLSWVAITALVGFRKRCVASGGPATDAARLALVGAIVSGLVWGFQIRGIGGIDEALLLFVTVPLAFLVGNSLEGKVAPQWVSATAVSARVSLLTFYSSYAVGQTVLWGGSLAWLWKGLPF